MPPCRRLTCGLAGVRATRQIGSSVLPADAQPMVNLIEVPGMTLFGRCCPKRDRLVRLEDLQGAASDLQTPEGSFARVSSEVYASVCSVAK